MRVRFVKTNQDAEVSDTYGMRLVEQGKAVPLKEAPPEEKPEEVQEEKREEPDPAPETAKQKPKPGKARK